MDAALPRLSDPLPPLRRPDGAHVHVCWVRRQEARAAAVALASKYEAHRWQMPASVAAGDIIVTVVAADPSIVVGVDAVDEVTSRWTFAEPLRTFSDPIAWRALVSRLGLDVPGRSHRLDDATGDRLLDVLNNDDLGPVAGPPTRCDATDRRGSDAVFVLRAMGLEADDDALNCEGCGEEAAEPQVHVFGDSDSGMAESDLGRTVESSALLCSRCHAMAHMASLQQLRAANRPACPACGAGNPREVVWGMPTNKVIHNDDYVIAGCALAPGIPPGWECRGCGGLFAVTPVPPGHSLFLVPDDDFPGYTG